MKVFHGGIQSIESPVILDTQRLLDFGKGFYTTTNQNQAERWAAIKKRRISNNSKAIVSSYLMSDDVLTNERYKKLKFTLADSNWLDFIVTNRKNDISHNYDIVIGPVANDTLYATLSLYESGILNRDETIKRLKIHKLFDQISFHNNEILKELRFIESYELFD